MEWPTLGARVFFKRFNLSDLVLVQFVLIRLVLFGFVDQRSRYSVECPLSEPPPINAPHMQANEHHAKSLGRHWGKEEPKNVLRGDSEKVKYPRSAARVPFLKNL